MSVRARLGRWFRFPRRLKLNRVGRAFVLLSIGVGFAAINTGNNLLYLILGWMLSVIVASGILSEQSLRGLEVSRLWPGAIYARRPFLVDISTRNRKRWLSSFSIEIEDLAGGRPLGKHCFFLKLAPLERHHARYRHTLPHRGLFSLDGFRVATQFPFSMFRKSKDLDDPLTVIVYPEVKPIDVPATMTRRQGEERQGMLGRRGEYFGLRELGPGDDARDVHWRSSARTGRLLVREYEKESHRRATVFVDNSLPPTASLAQKDELERAISLAASLAVALLHKNYAVRLVARGLCVPWANGPHQEARVLKALAVLATESPDTPYAGQPQESSHAILVAAAGRAPVGAPAGVPLATPDSLEALGSTA